MNALKLTAMAGAAALLAACSAEETETQCTTAPQSEWMDQEQFQAGLKEQGYDINEFKVLPVTAMKFTAKTRLVRK